MDFMVLEAVFINIYLISMGAFGSEEVNVCAQDVPAHPQNP